MTHEPTAHDADPFAVFHAGAASHPARQAWLLGELEHWLAGDLSDGRERKRVVAGALRAATTEAHRWLDERCDPHALVRVDLVLHGEQGHRRSVFTSLPSPVALLLICLDQCRVGDEVRVVQEFAKAGRVESSATWPFGMDEAEALTRPARVPVGAHG